MAAIRSPVTVKVVKLTEQLPKAAMPAWQAYSAMGTSKARHFSYLTELEDRYGSAGFAGVEGKLALRMLLQDHDAQVATFCSAMRELKAKDPQAHAELIACIASSSASTKGSGDSGNNDPA